MDLSKQSSKACLATDQLLNQLTVDDILNIYTLTNVG